MCVETIETKNFIAEIQYDETPCNPRTEWDNLCTMIMRGNRYNLGDENHTVDMDECESWEEVEALIRKEYGRDCLMLPIYIYDHSGITISTSPFSCRWDSGRVGTIVVSRATLRKELNWGRVTKERYEKAMGYLEGEVETYNQYLTGDVYGYEIYKKDENGDKDENEFDDSCWGYFGIEHVREDAQSMLNHCQDVHNKIYGQQTELELVA